MLHRALVALLRVQEIWVDPGPLPQHGQASLAGIHGPSVLPILRRVFATRDCNATLACRQHSGRDLQHILVQDHIGVDHHDRLLCRLHGSLYDMRLGPQHHIVSARPRLSCRLREELLRQPSRKVDAPELELAFGPHVGGLDDALRDSLALLVACLVQSHVHGHNVVRGATGQVVRVHHEVAEHLLEAPIAHGEVRRLFEAFESSREPGLVILVKGPEESLRYLSSLLRHTLLRLLPDGVGRQLACGVVAVELPARQRDLVGDVVLILGGRDLLADHARQRQRILLVRQALQTGGWASSQQRGCEQEGSRTPNHV
mmetsp:Transcript_89409/g.236449  ORF Transcript_89409/g.236449 Transcript_89409/m.236449 type:complete len:315 (-) Transcript_89409:52-996(-)